MEGVLQVSLPPSKKKRWDNLIFDMCILCQKEKKEDLVQTSKSTQKLLDALTTRRLSEDEEYGQVAEYLKDFTVAQLDECKGSWHLSCYKLCTRKDMIEKVQKQYIQRKQVSAESVCSSTPQPDLPYTRSRGIQLEKNTCFFCDKYDTKYHPLSTVATRNTGEKLFQAVQLSDNAAWKVKLSGCIDPRDAHAYDISYHNECYTKNVSNSLRNANLCNTESNISIIHSASLADFLEALSDSLFEGRIISMGEVENKYKEICLLNGMQDSELLSRKALKSVIQDRLFDLDIEFSNPRQKNQPQRISLKAAKDMLLSKAEDNFNSSNDMKTIFAAAKIIRKSILTCSKWKFNGSVAYDEKAIPSEVLFFFKWCTGGKSVFSTSNIRNYWIDQKSKLLSQTLMFECLSDKQTKCTNSINIQHTRSYPLQVGLGMSIHSATRSKSLVNLLFGFGFTINYSRILRLETAIANAVLSCMEQNEGCYVPPGLVRNRFIYFAADNLDFQEDTPEGKGTLHATVMTCYQEIRCDDKPPTLLLSDIEIKERSLHEIPAFMSDFKPYQGPKMLKPKNVTMSKEVLESWAADCSGFKIRDMVWLLCKCLSKEPAAEIDCLESAKEDDCVRDSTDLTTSRSDYVPTWSAFNAIIDESTCIGLTQVSVLPIIPASPTEHSIQLTFLSQLELLTKKISGHDCKCILTLDMGLYKPVQQLIMSRTDLQGRWILRPGELHISFAVVRVIGSFVDGTGIPEIWSVLYGESTVNQILAGKKFRRTLEAHTRTLVALQQCFLDVFFETHTELHETLCQMVKKFCENIHTSNSASAINDFCKELDSSNFCKEIENFDRVKSELSPTFKLMRQYMQMIETLLMFMRSVRTGNWDLHLATLEDLVKYFFALDLNNYSGMIAWYLAEMKCVQKSDPDVWKQFKLGNWVVKKSAIPFCALGADEALEHENRSMKVAGGLVGITQHPKALARFFLTAPELQRIYAETLHMTGVSESQGNKHHHLDSPSAAASQDVAISKLKGELCRVGNPFRSEGPELVNVVTKAVFSDEISRDVSRIKEIGSTLYTSFKTDRIMEGKVSLWAPIKRNKLKLCSTAKKKVTVKIAGTVTELTADRSLFARLLVVTRSNREVDLSETLGTYELSVVPRSMFASDGTMIQCTCKSKLLHILRDHPKSSEEAPQDINAPDPISFSVAIVDGMAEVQSLEKSNAMKTCEDLAVKFITKLENKYLKYNEIHLVFDSYMKDSIKNLTRDKRQQGGVPVHFKVSDKTDITNVTMSKLLGHIRTKDELTEYLSQKVLSHFKILGKHVVVAWRTMAAATHFDAGCLESTQEEADTKMILHGINAKERGASSLFIYAQDTDVLVLSVRRYLQLPVNSFFVPKPGEEISLRSIYMALGYKKAAALPGFHALSGCDSTGSLAGKGKLSYWKAFCNVPEYTLDVLAKLGSAETLEDEDVNELESFICKVYQNNTKITTLAALRWMMFRTKQYLSEKLPPTRAALLPALKRANYQALIWSKDDRARPIVPSPTDHGWTMKDDRLVPVLCDLPCAPDSVLQLVKCSCTKRCLPPCKCASLKLVCTEMCACNAADMCENVENDAQQDNSSDSSDTDVDSDDN